jgi:hypothetical protein
MKTATTLKVTPLENPHSRSTRMSGKNANKQNVMDELLEKIQEKSKQEYAESKKPKTLRKKGKLAPGDDNNIHAVESPDEVEPSASMDIKVKGLF